MKKTNASKFGKIALIAGGIVVTGALIWAFLVPKKATAKPVAPPPPPSLWGRNTPPSAYPPSPKTPSSGGSTYGNKSGYPIRKGSSGTLVELVQSALQSLGQDLPQYGADGKFGSETEAALVAVTGKASVDNEDELATLLRRSNEADAAKNGLGL